MENKTIGQIISEHRKQKGLTQRTLAEQLNVTDKAVSKWERDIARPDINTVPRLAEILDIPVETLINIPINTKPEIENETGLVSGEESISEGTPADNNAETWDEECEVHKDKARCLLFKGLLGFVAGFLFALIVTLSDGDSFDFVPALGAGLFLAGVPYGWELLGRLIGHWYVVGHIAIMILVFCFKFVGAILIGWATYPFALLYNIMKAQRKGSKARKIWTVVFGTVIVLISALAFIIVFAGVIQEQNEANSDTTGVTLALNKYAQVDASAFTSTRPEFVAICEKTMDSCKVDEDDYEASGSSVVTPSAIQAAYYLIAKDPDSQHVEYGKNIKFTNAVVVVTCCRVNIGNAIERDSWFVWVYPDFYLDAGDAMNHETGKEHSHFIGEQTLSGVYEFICEEYYDMDIFELGIPMISKLIEVRNTAYKP